MQFGIIGYYENFRLKYLLTQPVGLKEWEILKQKFKKCVQIMYKQ